MDQTIVNQTESAKQPIRWQISREDHRLVRQIVARAEASSIACGGRVFDRRDLEMDIAATHCNGCPLRLADLLTADDFNFAHDVWGIWRHIDRNTGRLLNHFLPRFAQPERRS